MLLRLQDMTQDLLAESVRFTIEYMTSCSCCIPSAFLLLFVVRDLLPSLLSTGILVLSTIGSTASLKPNDGPHWQVSAVAYISKNILFLFLSTCPSSFPLRVCVPCHSFRK